MRAKMTCIVLLMATLAMGAVAWGVQMPQAINNDRDLKSAVKAAKTPRDHERIAAYCRAKADRLDSEATGYEQAAASYRKGTYVKNLTSPTTAARYEYLAKGLREQAASSRQLAASQEQLIKSIEHTSK